MHQDAFPGEDIGDRPLPDVSVPGMSQLLEVVPRAGATGPRSLPIFPNCKESPTYKDIHS